ncbi:MAG: DUF1559 domain-containing protein [Planctomycetota bacterium]|nr:DUF1559 domain-containing protein [Planctomycetota bacterium]
MDAAAPNTEQFDDSQKRPSRRSIWPTLLTVGAVVLVLAAITFLARRATKDTENCLTCANNMRQLGLAVLMYQTSRKEQIPVYTVDANGKRLYSWRVHVLPYIEEKSLFNQYNFKEPFDSPHNQKFANRMDTEFCCPFHESTSETSYFLVTKNGKVGECEIDGEKVLMIEVPDRRVNWLSPHGEVECDEIPAIRARIKEMGHPLGIGIVLVDGSFKRLTE